MKGGLLFVLSISLGSIPSRTVSDGSADDAPEFNQQETDLRLISGAFKQKFAVFVYEKKYEHQATSVSATVEEGILEMFFEYRSFLTVLDLKMKELLRLPTLAELRDQLTFVLLCGKDCVETVMDHVTELDNSVGLRLVFRHFSTWVIISLDPPPDMNITIDHLAWVRLGRLQETCVLDTPPERDRKTREKSSEIYTLLWMPGGREWSRVHLYNLSHDQLFTYLFPNSQRGLNGRQLLITTLEMKILKQTHLQWLPYAIRENITERTSYVGASRDIIECLASEFNFSYVFVEPPDGLWGQRTRNGTWNGILGMINKAEADMCLVPYGVTYDRNQIMDFSTLLSESASKAVYRRRDDDMHSWLYLLSFISWEVYLCGAASLAWIALLMVFMRSVDRREHLSVCVEIGLHVPLRQALMDSPKHLSSRIVLFTWCLFCVVMTAVYSGNLVSVMTVKRQIVPFTTLEELTQHKEYAVGLFEGAYARDFLKNSSVPTHEDLLKKLTVVQLPEGSMYSIIELYETGMRNIMNGKFALIAMDPPIQYIRSQTCDVSTMEEKLFSVYSAFPFPRYSPLKKLFDKKLLHLMEAGLIEHWKSKWAIKPLKCDVPDHVPRLKSNHIKAVLVACAAGILFATVVLLVERWIWKKVTFTG